MYILFCSDIYFYNVLLGGKMLPYYLKRVKLLEHARQDE